eukprot:TRINITY_DN6166_c0_g1_i1.p1 TRINITY_DN6166_c0_g1~~TRINITY_DN6166_c0_g1_i1.p1  ORF type:complete len:287 (-),score=64.17 TRINITY_DN6166_c0_g1_i1:549-1292(-)
MTSFLKRNFHFLRIGPSTCLPLVLFLHDAASFNEGEFQELLLVVREYLLPGLLYFNERGFIDTNPSVTEALKPQIFSANDIKFAFVLRKTSPSLRVLRKTPLPQNDDRECSGTPLDGEEKPNAKRKRSTKQEDDNLDLQFRSIAEEEIIMTASEREKQRRRLEGIAVSSSTDDDEEEDGEEEEEDLYDGGEYHAYRVTDLTLVVETLSNNHYLLSPHEQMLTISHYFGGKKKKKNAPPIPTKRPPKT